MLLAFVWGMHSITAGFEVWTFEGRRQWQLRAGVLVAAPVALRDAYQHEPSLWREDRAAPAAYLVDFIYARCPGVCRALGSDYQQLQRQLRSAAGARQTLGSAAGGVHLVSISFDTEHDDAQALQQLALSLGADPAWWTFAVPATAADAQSLLRSLEVVVVPDGQGGFVHNGAIHLLDEHGRLRGLFEFDDWPAALTAARQLAAAPQTGRS